jgi:hypothetical protein
VEGAYRLACNAVPGCCQGKYPCARYFGDPNLRLVPQKVYRNPNVEGAVGGEVRDLNANLLTGVNVLLYKYGGGICGSDVASPDYYIEVDQTGEYWLRASVSGNFTWGYGWASGNFTLDTNAMPGIRNPWHEDYIDLTTPEMLEAGYVLDFEGDYGLAPTACDMSYAMESVNHWLYTPTDEYGTLQPDWRLSSWKAMASVHSWQYPS